MSPRSGSGRGAVCPRRWLVTAEHALSQKLRRHSRLHPAACPDLQQRCILSKTTWTAQSADGFGTPSGLERAQRAAPGLCRLVAVAAPPDSKSLGRWIKAGTEAGGG